MSNRMSYLLKTVRGVHGRGFAPAPSSSAAPAALWLGTRRGPVEKAEFRTCLLTASRRLHEPSPGLPPPRAGACTPGSGPRAGQEAEAAAGEEARGAGEAAGSRGARRGPEPPEPFLRRLRRCACPSDALDLAAARAASAAHAANSLAAAWRLLRGLSEEQRRYERRLVLEHPAFAPLCQRLLRDARRLARGDLVFGLHALVSLGVPQGTLLVQTLLRVCQEKLNQLDNRCLSVLATALIGLEKDQNVSALQAGLRLLVEQRIPHIRDIFILQNLMKCIGKDAPVSLKKKLEKAVLKDVDHLTFLNAQRVFFALVAMNYCSIPILNACSEKIMENIHDAPFRQLILILEACHNLQYRNIKLFSGVANYVTSTVCLWDKRQIILLLSAFETLGFQPTELMDIFAEKVTEDPEFLNLKYLLIILRVYSQLNYLPRGQKQLFIETLHSCLNKYLPNISSMELLKAVYSLCILGYLPHPALDQLLQKENLDELQSGDLYTDQKDMMLQCVKACVELDSPTFTKPALVLAEDFSSVSFSHRKAREALLELLGDENMFRENVQLLHKYHIDFEIRVDSERKKVLPVTATDDQADSGVERNVVDNDMVFVLTETEFPMTLQNNNSPSSLPPSNGVQNLCVRQGDWKPHSRDNLSLLLAFLFVPLSAFCIGTTHPQGKLAVKKRHVTKLGYEVVMVINKKFQEMTNEDAVEFLKGKIYSRSAFPFSEANVQSSN